MDDKKQLTQIQLDTLSYLLDMDGRSTRQLSAWLESTRNLNDRDVAEFLSDLLARGFVEMRRRGNTRVIFPLITREEVVGCKMMRLLDGLFEVPSERVVDRLLIADGAGALQEATRLMGDYEDQYCEA